MSNKSRSKLLAAALGLVIGCAALLEGLSEWQSPWGSRRTQIEALRSELQQQTQQLHRRDEQSQSLRRWSKMALPIDEAKAAAVYYPYLTELTDACGFKQVALAPTAGDRDSGDIGGLRLSVTAEATVNSWDRFFQMLRATPALQQVLRWDLQGGEDGLVRGSVVLEAIRYVGAVDADKAFVLPEPVASVTAFGERNWFGDRAAFVASDTPPVAAESSEAVVESSPPRFTLVGIYGDASNGEAWLYDAETESRLVLQRHSTFEVGAQQGTVDAVDIDGVTLVLGGRKQRLHLGERLQ
jgi:hypothetical protein